MKAAIENCSTEFVDWHNAESVVQPTITDKTIVWEFTNARAGEIRFTIKIIEKGQWFETGELSRDAEKTWLKFFEMTLDKASS